MPSQKPVIAIRTSQEIINKFNYIADEENRSMSNLGEHLIKKYIKDYESINGEISIESDENKSM